MISLITGMPGMGKTSLMVHMLVNRKDLQNRPIYVDGIPELKIPHEPVPEGESMETWHLWAPDGSILVIDEAQRIFRPRPAGAKVPDYIQALETHRHKGIDIFVLTQHPRLIDVNLRSLVGEHRNISRTMLGFSRVSYWQRCANPEARADVAEAKNSIFLLKKSVFGLYKSASEHTKIKGATTIWLYVFPFLVAIVLYFAYSLNQSYENKLQGDAPQQIQQDAALQQPVSATGVYPATASQPEMPDNNLKPEDWTPAIDGQPWTAPIYNGHNRNIQTMPYPVACVQNGSKCTCYTDQATPLTMDKGLCQYYVEHGIYNPYKALAVSDNTAAGTAAPSVSGGQVAILGGSSKPNLAYSSDAPRSAQ